MIPGYQTLMPTVLKACANGEVSTADTVETLAGQFGLSEEEKEQMLPSGKQTNFSNRIHWAKGYLKQAGLLRYPSRRNFITTEAGKSINVALAVDLLSRACESSPQFFKELMVELLVSDFRNL